MKCGPLWEYLASAKSPCPRLNKAHGKQNAQSSSIQYKGCDQQQKFCSANISGSTVIFRALAYQEMTYNQEKTHKSALTPKTREEKHYNSAEPQQSSQQSGSFA